MNRLQKISIFILKHEQLDYRLHWNWILSRQKSEWKKGREERGRERGKEGGGGEGETEEGREEVKNKDRKKKQTKNESKISIKWNRKAVEKTEMGEQEMGKRVIAY